MCRVFQRSEHDVFLIFHLDLIHIFRYIEKPDSRQTWSISRCSRSGFERQPRSSTHFHSRNNQFNDWQIKFHCNAVGTWSRHRSIDAMFDSKFSSFYFFRFNFLFVAIEHVVAVQSAAKAIQDGSREAIEWSRVAASPELIAQRVQ